MQQTVKRKPAKQKRRSSRMNASHDSFGTSCRKVQEIELSISGKITRPEGCCR